MNAQTAAEKVDQAVGIEGTNVNYSSDENIVNAQVDWTEAEEKVTRNKLDWQLVPMVTLLYLLCFLDR